jgi:hypothetical protein
MAARQFSKIASVFSVGMMKLTRGQKKFSELEGML